MSILIFRCRNPRYLIYTADFPVTKIVHVTTFSENKALLLRSTDPNIDGSNLQKVLNKADDWCTEWEVSVDRNNPLTFSLQMGKL